MRLKLFILSIVAALAFSSCEETPVPKPRAYARIDFPVKEYVAFRSSCPFEFEMPHRAFMDTTLEGKPNCWMNLHYPQYAATVHLTYSPLGSKPLGELIEDARKMAMKHVVKADAIEEGLINFKDKKVHGLYYDFGGSTATSFQFFVTDSSEHFLRASMYFNLPPNPDSLEPVNIYIKKDLMRMLETFSWK